MWTKFGDHVWPKYQYGNARHALILPQKAVTVRYWGVRSVQQKSEVCHTHRLPQTCAPLRTARQDGNPTRTFEV